MKPILIIPGGGNGDMAIPIQIVHDLGRDALAYPETNKPWDDSKDLSDFIVGNGFVGCHIVGCSLGGVVAVHYIKHFEDAPLRVSSVSTLDSPLYRTRRDGLAYFHWLLSLRPYNHIYSGSGFMQALRNDPLPSVPAFQWMNDYTNGGYGGFAEQVLPVAPTPHFNEPHIALYNDVEVWRRVLEGLS